MAEHPVQEYSSSVEELRKARANVQTLRDIIATVGNNLLRPYEFSISNVGIGLPAEVTLVPGVPTLNANDWPTAKQIT